MPDLGSRVAVAITGQATSRPAAAFSMRSRFVAVLAEALTAATTSNLYRWPFSTSTTIVPSMRILGIDAPRGWACLDVERSGRGSVLAYGLLDDGRETDELTERIESWKPERVAIETTLEPYIGGRAADGGKGARRALGISLLRVARLGGRLEERAITCGLRTLVFDAAHVRRGLGIHGKTETELDRNVKTFLTMMVPNWPARSNDHERDAGVACLWAGRQA
jgi:hypothetical protein